MTKVLHPSELMMNVSLRKTLSDLESLSPFERRLKLKPSLNQRFFYKYRPLEKVEHINWLRDYLIESRFWLSSPRSFNDPFDMTFWLEFEGSPQEKRERLETLYKNRISRKDAARRDVLVSEQLNSPATLLEGIRQTYKTHIAKSGVCSLTADPRNILMWSHYASNHSGVCLQFEAIQDVVTFTMAASVKYEKNYPRINWAEHTSSEIATQQIGKVLTCKYQDWGYEKEHRIVVPDAADKYLLFSETALTGIIFGCQIEEKCGVEVRKLLRERVTKGLPSVKTYKAHRHSEAYKLRLLSK